MSFHADYRRRRCGSCPTPCQPWLDGTLEVENKALACPIRRWFPVVDRVKEARPRTKKILSGELSGPKAKPGTVLKKMLALVGIKDSRSCRCSHYATKMNNRGVEWCRENMDIILGWLETEAKVRKLPFNRLLARVMVEAALRTASLLKK